MKRRSFFKLFAAAPAVVALPAANALPTVAENKGATYAGTGSHHNNVAPYQSCEMPSHTHTPWPCPGCYYVPMPATPGGSHLGQQVGALRCKRQYHCGGTA